MTRAARPALAVAPARAAVGAAVGGRPAVAVATSASPAAATTGADARQLLDGPAGECRVTGEAQADAATLAVDLDHADFDLVALVEDVLDGLHALAGRDV